MSPPQTPLGTPQRLELRVSRAFVLLAADTTNRVLRGRDGVLYTEDAQALAGAIVRTASGAQISVADLTPQLGRLVLLLSAGPPTEVEVLTEGVTRARRPVSGEGSREALVLQRRGQRWTATYPADRIPGIATYLARAGVTPVREPAPAQGPGRAPAPRRPDPPSPSDQPAVAGGLPTRRRSRSRMLVVCVVGALAVGGGVAAFTVARSQRDSAQTGEAPSTLAKPVTDPNQLIVQREPNDDVQGREVAEALARLADDPASLLASGRTDQTAKMARAAVPAGTKVDVDPASWAPDGIGGGALRVTLLTPDGRSTDYVAVMVQEEADWKVLSTVPIGRP